MMTPIKNYVYTKLCQISTSKLREFNIYGVIVGIEYKISYDRNGQPQDEYRLRLNDGTIEEDIDVTAYCQLDFIPPKTLLPGRIVRFHRLKKNFFKSNRGNFYLGGRVGTMASILVFDIPIPGSKFGFNPCFRSAVCYSQSVRDEELLAGLIAKSAEIMEKSKAAMNESVISNESLATPQQPSTSAAPANQPEPVFIVPLPVINRRSINAVADVSSPAANLPTTTTASACNMPPPSIPSTSATPRPLKLPPSRPPIKCVPRIAINVAAASTANQLIPPPSIPQVPATSQLPQNPAATTASVNAVPVADQIMPPPPPIPSTSAGAATTSRPPPLNLPPIKPPRKCVPEIAMNGAAASTDGQNSMPPPLLPGTLHPPPPPLKLPPAKPPTICASKTTAASTDINLFKNMSQLICSNLGYYNVLFQIVSCYKDYKGNAILRVWDGTRQERNVHVAPASEITLIYGDQKREDLIHAQRKLYDIICYDNHATQAAKLSAGDYIALINVHFFIPNRCFLPSLIMHSGSGKNISATGITRDGRRIVKITKETALNYFSIIDGLINESEREILPMEEKEEENIQMNLLPPPMNQGDDDDWNDSFDEPSSKRLCIRESLSSNEEGNQSFSTQTLFDKLQNGIIIENNGNQNKNNSNILENSTSSLEEEKIMDGTSDTQMINMWDEVENAELQPSFPMSQIL